MRPVFAIFGAYRQVWRPCGMCRPVMPASVAAARVCEGPRSWPTRLGPRRPSGRPAGLTERDFHPFLEEVGILLA